MDKSNEDIVLAISALLSLIDNLSASMISLHQDVNSLRIQVREAERRQDKALAAYGARLEQAETRLEKMQARLDKLQEELDNLRAGQ